MHGGKHKSIALSCNIVTMFLTVWCSCAGAASFPSVSLSHTPKVMKENDLAAEG